MTKILAHQKMKNAPIQVKAAFWFTVCSFVVKGISFISAPIFARVLPSDEYGVVAVFNSYQHLFLILATLELSLGAYSKGYIKYSSREYEFTANLLIVSNIVTIIFGIIVLAFLKPITKLLCVGNQVVFVMLLYFFVQPAYQCWMYRERYNYRYRNAIVVTILSAATTTFIPLICLFLFKKEAQIKILAMLVVWIIISSPFYFSSLAQGKGIRDKQFFNETARFCLAFQMPLVLHSLSFLILGQSDRVMIGEMVGKTEAGIYSVAYGMAMVVTIFQTSLNQVFQPYRYQNLESGEYDAIRRTSNILLIIFAGVILSFILVAPEIITILFPAEYYDAIKAIPPIAIGIFFMFLYSIFVDVESYFEKTKYVMYASCTCALTNIILNYYFIKNIGYIACAYSTLLCYIMFAGMHYLFVKRTCSKIGHFQVKQIFDVKSIVLISATTIFMGALILLFYEQVIIRYIVLIIFMAVVLINRRGILNLFYDRYKK